MITRHSAIAILLSVGATVGISCLVSGCGDTAANDAQPMDEIMNEAHKTVARKELVSSTRVWASDVQGAITLNRTIANSLKSSQKASNAGSAAGGPKSQAETDIERKLADEDRKILAGLKRITTSQLYAHLESDTANRDKFLDDIHGVSGETEKPVDVNTWVYQSTNMSSVYVVFENGRFRISNITNASISVE